VTLRRQAEAAGVSGSPHGGGKDREREVDAAKDHPFQDFAVDIGTADALAVRAAWSLMGPGDFKCIVNVPL